MVNSNEHGMGNGNNRAVFTPSGSNTLVLSGKIGAFHISGRLCALDQDRFQSLVALCCFSVPAFACAFVISRADASPGGNVVCAGKASHICINLRKDDLRTALSDSGEFIFLCTSIPQQHR